MRRVVLSAFALLIVAAMPALAQGYGTTDTATTPTETTEGTVEHGVTSPNVQETRSTPNARSIAAGDGLTLTGTVSSWNDNQLVLRTTTGVEHIQLVPETVGATSLASGQTVSVDYTRNSQGVMIAKQIRMGEAPSAAATASAATAGDAEAAGAAVEDTLESAGEAVEDAADDLAASEPAPLTTTASDTAATLPATGSKSPLLALLGLLAVATAAVLRRT